MQKVAFPAAAQSAPPGQESLKADRDRFVALAFCWADFLLEVDTHETIIFAGGPWQGLAGIAQENLRGYKLEDLVHRDDMDLMRSLLKVAKRQGRIEDVDIRFQGKMKRALPISFAGYFLEEMDGHYFLAMRVSRKTTGGLIAGGHQRAGDSNLFEASSFADVLGGKLKVANDVDTKDNQLTLINMEGMEELKGRLNENQRANLSKTLGVYLRASSIDGDSAAQLDGSKFSLIHDQDMDVQNLEAHLSEVAREYDPAKKGVAIKAATLDVDAENISQEDLANGLVYAINRFKDSDASDFNLHELSSNLSSLVKDAASKVSTFKTTVANRAFHLVFHPIVDVLTGKIHHFEALTRFQEGVSPFEIITMAEETGLIPEFDLAVVDKSLEFLNTIPRNSPLSIAINISGQSVASDWYVERLHRKLAENEWAQGRLLFEITESAKMKDLDRANTFIQRLRKDHYKVCLDDFGAGAASFGYLMRLEVDVVKLDGPVVKDAQRVLRGKALLQSMATLCKNLGIETIAEMVDDKVGIDFVRKCGINYAQGYLFGKPNANVKAFNMARHIHLFPNPAFASGKKW